MSHVCVLMEMAIGACLLAPGGAAELPGAARQRHEEALVAMDRGELARADALLEAAYAEVDRAPDDALTFRAGRDLLLGTRRVVLRRLATATDDPRPLCRLRQFLRTHRDALVRSLGERGKGEDTQGIDQRIREVDQELAQRATSGGAAACGTAVAPATVVTATTGQPAETAVRRPPAETAVMRPPAETAVTRPPAETAVTRPPAETAVRRPSAETVGRPAPEPRPVVSMPSGDLDRAHRFRRAGAVVLATSAVPLGVMIYSLLRVQRDARWIRELDAELEGLGRPATADESALADRWYRDGSAFRATAIATGLVGAVMMYSGIGLLIKARRLRRPPRMAWTPSAVGVTWSGSF